MFWSDSGVLIQVLPLLERNPKLVMSETNDCRQFLKSTDSWRFCYFAVLHPLLLDRFRLLNNLARISFADDETLAIVSAGRQIRECQPKSTESHTLVDVLERLADDVSKKRLKSAGVRTFVTDAVVGVSASRPSMKRSSRLQKGIPHIWRLKLVCNSRKEIIHIFKINALCPSLLQRCGHLCPPSLAPSSLPNASHSSLHEK
jgi:hypothetical protein